MLSTARRTGAVCRAVIENFTVSRRQAATTPLLKKPESKRITRVPSSQASRTRRIASVTKPEAPRVVLAFPSRSREWTTSPLLARWSAGGGRAHRCR
jgi:hypothetical protein